MWYQKFAKGYSLILRDWKTLKTENHGAENEIENSLVLNLPTYLTLQAGESGGHKRQSFH